LPFNISIAFGFADKAPQSISLGFSFNNLIAPGLLERATQSIIFSSIIFSYAAFFKDFSILIFASNNSIAFGLQDNAFQLNFFTGIQSLNSYLKVSLFFFNNILQY